MAYKKSKAKRPYRRRRRGYGTKAKFIPRGLATKRYNQISTKTFYFKANGNILPNAGGQVNSTWLTKRVVPAQGGNPSYQAPPTVADWVRISQCYSEYKVLAIKLRLFPANIGTESELPGISANPFNRGNALTFLDQSIQAGQQISTALNQVMNLGSSRMFIPRHYHTRTLYRPKGHPGWGNCDPEIPAPTRKPDPWWGGIFLLINGATPSGPQISFHQVTYKVIFRGRNISPPSPLPLELDPVTLING